MVYKFAIRSEHFLDILEIILAAVVIVGFALSFYNLVREIPQMFAEEENGQAFHAFLEFALNLVVGIEFTKMLLKHTPGSVLEVLLFAIARHVVPSHESGIETLLCIGAIAGIFAIRKFLYSETFETEEEGKRLDWLAPPTTGKNNCVRRSAGTEC